MPQLSKEELEELEDLCKHKTEYAPTDEQLLEWWTICEFFIGDNNVLISKSMLRFIKDRKVVKGGLKANA